MTVAYNNGMKKVAYYRKFKGFWTTMPKAVYNILKGGTYTLSKIPGLETLSRETMEDPEVKFFLRRIKVN
jgi:hypothetical protein